MASGDTLLVYMPLSAELPVTNRANLDTRNSRFMLAYDADSLETAYFVGIMPQLYGAGGVSVIIHWAATLTTGDVDWEVGFERLNAAAQDLDADGFAINQGTAGTGVPATAGQIAITTVNLSNAEIDGVVAGDLFRIRLERTNTDTYTGNAEVYGVEIREQ